MYQHAKRTAILVTCAVTCLQSGLSAQSLWMDQTSDRAIFVEFLKPEFEGADNADFLTSDIFLSGRFPITSVVAVEAEMPFSRYGTDDGAVERSQSAIGNPYLGARIRGSALTTRVGVRLPVASGDDGTALTSGRLTDYDRFEAFLPDVFSVNASFAGPTQLSESFVLNMGGGPALLLFTEDTGGDDSEIYAQYFLVPQYNGQMVTVKAGVTGRALMTESDLNFGERSSHQVGMAAALNYGTVRPGLHLRIPLDEDLSEDIDYVLGVNATVVLQ